MMLTKLRMNIIDVTYTTINTDLETPGERFDNPKNLFQKFHNLNSFITITPPH